jgi:hypothetical protein
VHVLRNVHRALRPRGLALDIHPLGVDFTVRTESRGLGFVDVSQFVEVLDAMERGVAAVVREGLLTEVRTLRRHVVERFDSPQELLEEADGWDNLRLPGPVRRKVRQARGPVELVDTILYRLFRRR